MVFFSLLPKRLPWTVDKKFVVVAFQPINLTFFIFTSQNQLRFFKPLNLLRNVWMIKMDIVLIFNTRNQALQAWF